MILDSLEHLDKYAKLHAGIATVKNFLASHKLQALPLGRFEIKGDDVFVSVNAYTTSEHPKVEFHESHVDIQVILEGYEQIGWVPRKDLHNVTPYDVNKDIAFGEGATQKMEAVPGQFFVFFPEDAHQPGIGNGNLVKKAVFKIKL